MNAIRDKINWTGPIEAAIVAAIILGATIPFFVLNKNEISEFRKETKEQITAIQQEMKDFHASLIRIEERRAGG